MPSSITCSCYCCLTCTHQSVTLPLLSCSLSPDSFSDFYLTYLTQFLPSSFFFSSSSSSSTSCSISLLNKKKELATLLESTPLASFILPNLSIPMTLFSSSSSSSSSFATTTTTTFTPRNASYPCSWPSWIPTTWIPFLEAFYQFKLSWFHSFYSTSSNPYVYTSHLTNTNPNPIHSFHSNRPFSLSPSSSCPTHSLKNKIYNINPTDMSHNKKSDEEQNPMQDLSSSSSSTSSFVFLNLFLCQFQAWVHSLPIFSPMLSSTSLSSSSTSFSSSCSSFHTKQCKEKEQPQQQVSFQFTFPPLPSRPLCSMDEYEKNELTYPSEFNTDLFPFQIHPTTTSKFTKLTSSSSKKQTQKDPPKQDLKQKHQQNQNQIQNLELKPMYSYDRELQL